MTRALLTDREKEVLAGEAKDVEYPDKYQSNTRARIRDRISQIEEDLQTLDEHEPNLADELRTIICQGSEHNKLHDVLDDIQADVETILNQLDEK